ncbi:MAG: UDP-4-amino-4,6-dideoxy-N-acetyl-beta-L-altrosamine N-acetyltransferase [Synergistaceae bacterium]|nr:UDP-4-amino-4,6-dideoxy-N-acetyl-beta-L-altrosamine N-acetyltransferase [Synergistaceae bacterium]
MSDAMNVEMTRVREDDLDMIMDWRMRPYITRYMNTDPVLTREGQRKWFQHIQNSEDQIHWVIRLDGKPIGLINVVEIDRVNSRCSWGYYIAEKEYRSLQLAMFLEWSLYDYVFDVLKLHKLCNETWTENAQVVKLHIMCGSTQDGIMRQHIYKNGVFHDVSIGSILAEEWFSKRVNAKYDRFNFE